MGFTKARVDGVVLDLEPKMQVDRYKTHDIEIVVDRIIADEGDRFRIAKSVQTALNQGKGVLMVRDEEGEVHHFSKYLMDPETDSPMMSLHQIISLLTPLTGHALLVTALANRRNY